VIRMTFLAAALGAFAALAAQTPLNPAMVERANTLNDQLADFYHDPASVQQNLTHPLMGDDPLKTADGTAFNAAVGCQSTNRFMQLLAMPTAGGEVSFNIELDRDMDGNLDSLFTEAAVSGVCANGYIRCDSGSWENCRHYQWQVDSAMVLTGSPVPIAQQGDRLKSCYCINNACGQGLVVKNLATIIKDAGAGIAAAYQNVNPYYTISNIQTDGPLMRFYGQEPVSCQADFNVNLTSYKNNSNGITNAAFTQAQSDRVYHGIAASLTAGNQGYGLQSCQITRELTITETMISDVIEYVKGAGQLDYCGPDCIELTIGRLGDDYWQGDCTAFETSTTFNVKRPELIREVKLIKAVFDDWIYVQSNGFKVYAGPYEWDGEQLPTGKDCEQKTSWNKDLVIYFGDTLKAGGLVEFNTKVLVSGRGEGYTKARIYVDLAQNCRVSGEAIHNACLAYEQNPDCDLKDETVDGVTTWQQFVSTGLIPIAQTQVIGGEVCAATITRDWFSKSRNYGCNTGTIEWDIATGFKRMDTIVSSASTTGYTDQQYNQTAGWSAPQNIGLTIPDIATPPACISTCKSHKRVADNGVNQLGLIADNRADSSRYDTFYHECQANTCPLGDGEQLLTACRCMDAFPEAATIMQILRLSGKDMICSSGETHSVGP
jgi:hypothetical protein